MRQSSYSISLGKKDIRELAGDHFVNINIKVAKTDVESSLVKGVLPAGTVVNNRGIPANDATAFGIVYSDIEFNDSMGTEILPVMIHGFVNKAKLKKFTNVDIAQEAIKAMNMISFL
ncbi:hypothetical protein WG909_13125 [Peptostreptococcaceae bacterium AGR-M142]